MFPIHLPIDCLRDHEMAGRRGRGGGEMSDDIYSNDFG